MTLGGVELFIYQRQFNLNTQQLSRLAQIQNTVQTYRHTGNWWL